MTRVESSQGADESPLLIAKATDENLASENWGLNLEVCDKVSTDGTNG